MSFAIVRRDCNRDHRSERKFIRSESPKSREDSQGDAPPLLAPLYPMYDNVGCCQAHKSVGVGKLGQGRRSLAFISTLDPASPRAPTIELGTKRRAFSELRSIVEKIVCLRSRSMLAFE